MDNTYIAQKIFEECARVALAVKHEDPLRVFDQLNLASTQYDRNQLRKDVHRIWFARRNEFPFHCPQPKE